jgi:hypothetical protein
MSRSYTATFSASPYFYDRGEYGAAQPITERINVRVLVRVYLLAMQCLDSPILDRLYHIITQREWAHIIMG